MELSEIIERNFTVSLAGQVIDDAGNEWRGEDGSVKFIMEKDRKKFNEFLSLINDDPDFNYDDNDFIEWIKDNNLV